MSNDNTPENNELDPTVQAVVNALNDRSKFEPSYVKQNINEMSIADRVKARQEANAAKRGAAEEGKAKDWLAQRGISGGKAEAMMKRGAEAQAARLQKGKDAALKRNMEEEVEQTEELINDGSIVVDIVEEDGQIVALDNGVLFLDDDIPAIEYIEQFYGSDYIDAAIYEATTPAKAPVKTTAKTPVKAPVKAAAPAKTTAAAPKPTGTATTTNTQVKKKQKTAAQKAADKAAANRVAPEKGKADKPTTSTTASNVAQRARDTKLTTTDLDLSISDNLKGSDQVNTQNLKDAAAKMKPGELKKTGGFLGFGGKYTYKPGDVSAFDTSTKDFTKKVADAAANIKLDREKKAVTPAPTDAKEPWETTGSEPGPTDGGKDVLDQLEKDTAAIGGGAGGGSSDTSGRRKVPINFRIAGQAGTVEREAYKKAKDTGEIESQDVSFNVRNAKTGERRAIKKGDPEYDQYLSRYKKMSQAVYEALIRMGAILTEEGWTLNGELLESVYTEYAPVEMTSSYYYDSTGRLRIMTESEWSQLGLATVILERAIIEAMDEVGKEDEDVDNDGDSDSSDDYLKNRREKIAAKMKEKLDEKVSRNIYRSPQPTRNLNRPVQQPMPRSAESNLKNRNVAAQNRMRGVVSGAELHRQATQLNASTVDPYELEKQQMSTQDAVALGAAGAQALNTPLKSGGKASGSSFLTKVAEKIKRGVAAGPGKVAALGNEIAGDKIPEYDATTPRTFEPQQAQPKPRKSAMMESNPFPWRK